MKATGIVRRIDDLGRGGVEPNIAYTNRGFIQNSNGEYIYSRKTFSDKYRYFQLVDAIGDVSIPAKVKNYTINCVETDSFIDMPNIQIKTITLPNTIKLIKSGAFANIPCLKSIYIPSSVEKIQDGARPQDCKILVDKNSYAHNYLDSSIVEYDYELKEPVANGI